MAKVLERVTPFDTEGVPSEAFSPAGPSQSKLLSAPGGDSQVKLSSGQRLNLLAAQPLYIPLAEEGAPWNDLPRGPQQS